MKLIQSSETDEICSCEGRNSIALQVERRERGRRKTGWNAGQLVVVQRELFQQLHPAQRVLFDLDDVAVVEQQQPHLRNALEIASMQPAEIVTYRPKWVTQIFNWSDAVCFTAENWISQSSSCSSSQFFYYLPPPSLAVCFVFYLLRKKQNKRKCSGVSICSASLERVSAVSLASCLRGKVPAVLTSLYRFVSSSYMHVTRS